MPPGAREWPPGVDDRDDRPSLGDAPALAYPARVSKLGCSPVGGLNHYDSTDTRQMKTDDHETKAEGYKGISGGARALWLADDAREAAEMLGGDAGGDD